MGAMAAQKFTSALLPIEKLREVTVVIWTSAALSSDYKATLRGSKEESWIKIINE